MRHSPAGTGGRPGDTRPVGLGAQRSPRLRGCPLGHLRREETHSLLRSPDSTGCSDKRRCSPRVGVRGRSFGNLSSISDLRGPELPVSHPPSSHLSAGNPVRLPKSRSGPSQTRHLSVLWGTVLLPWESRGSVPPPPSSVHLWHPNPPSPQALALPDVRVADAHLPLPEVSPDLPNHPRRPRPTRTPLHSSTAPSADLTPRRPRGNSLCPGCPRR